MTTAVPLELRSCRVNCEWCWDGVAEAYVDVRWADGAVELLRLCDRCLCAFELDLEDADEWTIGPLGTDGMPLEICRN